MSGHSKWHSIKHKKGAADAKRGKVFTRHANLITIAARQGGEVDMNPSLRLAIENAKRENVPNANIERAVKRGTGELKGESELNEVTYEGYGPAGTAVLVECLTDNKNRTYTNIRTVFGKKGGNLGNSGSVAWMFERKGVITYEIEKESTDDLEMAAIEAEALDIEKDGSLIEIYTSPGELNEINEKLKEKGFISQNAEVLMIPKEKNEVTDIEEARKVMEFIDNLEEDMDVTNVSSNADISEELLNQL